MYLLDQGTNTKQLQSQGVVLVIKLVSQSLPWHLATGDAWLRTWQQANVFSRALSSREAVEEVLVCRQVFRPRCCCTSTRNKAR